MKPLSWNEYVRLAMSYAIFSENEDTGWTVEIPVLPGCVTWGETRMDAAAMAEDAVHGWLETSLRFGDAIPVRLPNDPPVPPCPLPSRASSES